MLLLAGNPDCKDCCCVDVTIRPNEDVSVGSFEDSTGGNNNGILYDDVNEAVADDSNFIRGTIPALGSTTYDVGFDESGVSGTTVSDWGSVTLRVRARHNGSLNYDISGELLNVDDFVIATFTPSLMGNPFDFHDLNDFSLNDFPLTGLHARIRAAHSGIGGGTTTDISFIELTFNCP